MNPREETRNPQGDPHVNQARVLRTDPRAYPGGTELNIEFPSATRVVTASALSVVAAIAAGLIINSDEEAKSGADHATKQLKQVEALKGLTDRQKREGGFVNAVREAACSGLDDLTFTHTIYTSTPEGPDEFNMLTFFVPLQLHLDKACIAKIKVGVKIPYIFAKTFTEIAVSDEQARLEILKQFAEVLKAQLSGEEIIRGIPQWTNFQGLYEVASKRIGGTDLSEKNVIVRYAKADAGASDEVIKGDAGGVKSLGVRNPENDKLASDRLGEILEKFPAIMEAAGITKDQIGRISNVMVRSSKEVVLAQQQIVELAQIASKIQPFPSRATVQERAYWLISEHNSGNQTVIKYLESDENASRVFTNLILASRAVTLDFVLDAQYKSREVFAIPFPLPLLLLLLIPIIRVERRDSMYIPPSIYRRIFSSQRNPHPEDPLPRFEEVYESLPSAQRANEISDLDEITKMFIVDEIAPSFEKDKYRGFESLDYEKMLSWAMNPYITDSYVQNIERKYLDRDSARAEAVKKMTRDLAKMWEEHDRIFTYSDPERDLSIPYERSKKVVAQAKAIAEYVVWHMDKQIDSEKGSLSYASGEYADRIKDKIKAQAEDLMAQGFQSRIKLFKR